MPLTPENGNTNMYEWIQAKWNPIGGKCPHECSYCYVPKMPYTQEKYGGEPRLIEKELETTLYKVQGHKPPLTIFVCNMTDLFADNIPKEWIERVLNRCSAYPENTYLFQTKNPKRFLEFMFPPKTILGITLETNADTHMYSKAPIPAERYESFKRVQKRFGATVKYMVTIEPIMKFDDRFLKWLIDLCPDWINLGADSKDSGLPEPSAKEIRELLTELEGYCEVKLKPNIRRILK